MTKHVMQDRAAVTAFTILRLGVGMIMVVHGAMKIADPGATIASFSNMGVPAPELTVYLAIAGELFGGLGLLLGLLTRLAALGPLCVMLSAIIFVHLGNGLLANNGGWEYPLTLLLVSLLYVVNGGGPVSLDAFIKKQQRERGVGLGRAQRPAHSS